MRATVLTVLAACNGGFEPVVCGDGVAEDFEQCDDGNRVSGDGCDATCQPEPRTGVIWAFYPSVGGPEQPGCRAGVSEIEIVTSTAPTINRFPCDSSHSAMIFTPGQPQVLTRLRAANNDIIAESIPQLALGAPLAAAFYEDAGYLLVVLEGCAQWVNLAITPPGGGTTQQRLTCFNLPIERLYSKPLAAGTYQIQLTGEVTDTRTVEIGANNAVTELNFLEAP